jgi:predicted nucleic acid-binding protein
LILLDTNICINIINARPAAVLQRFRDYRMGDIGICSVVAAELAYGVAKSGSERNRQALDLFLAPEIRETSLHMSTETHQREEPAEQKTTTTKANHKNSLQKSPKPEQ